MVLPEVQPGIFNFIMVLGASRSDPEVSCADVDVVTRPGREGANEEEEEAQEEQET